MDSLKAIKDKDGKITALMFEDMVIDINKESLELMIQNPDFVYGLINEVFDREEEIKSLKRYITMLENGLDIHKLENVTKFSDLYCGKYIMN